MDLIKHGYECEVYRINANIVYKKYRNGLPETIKYQAKLKHPNIEPVFSYDSIGYKTRYYNQDCGTFSIYKIIHKNTTEIIKSIQSVRDYLKEHNIKHNDLTPKNILYDERYGIAITDWTKINLEPHPVLNQDDEVRFKHWLKIVKEKKHNWFSYPIPECCWQNEFMNIAKHYILANGPTEVNELKSIVLNKLAELNYFEICGMPAIFNEVSNVDEVINRYIPYVLLNGVEGVYEKHSKNKLYPTIQKEKL